MKAPSQQKIVPLHSIKMASALTLPSVNARKCVKSKHYNFFYSLRPIYYMSRLFGLMPFSIVCDLNGSIQSARVSVFDLIWFLTAICIYLSMGWVCFQNIKTIQYSTMSYTLLIGDGALLTLALINSAKSIIMDMLNRFRFIEILKSVTSFDDEVKKLGVHLNFKKKLRRLLFWCIGSTTVQITFTVITFLVYKRLRSKSDTYILKFVCSYVFQPFVAVATLTIYFVLIFNLYRRFQVINDLLRKRFLSDITNRVPINLSKEESIAFIKLMGRLHELLTEIMEKINYCYSLQVMTVVGASFGLSILTFYAFYRNMVQENEFFSMISHTHLLWQIYYLTGVIIVIYGGHMVTSESKKTSKVLHRIINRHHDADVSLSLTQFSLQILHRHAVATCGLFAFNWTLLYTMISAATIYLTILVQFDSSNDSRVRN